MNRIAILLSLVLGLLMLGACAMSRSGSYTPLREQNRNPFEAQRLTARALEVIDEKPERAEQLLREALTADLYHGPAHNNLGVLYLSQNLLYDAANEFEWASKLMPGHPDPRLNLALVLETAGRTDEALATYATALEVYPGHIHTIQALARLQVRSGNTCSRTAALLDTIAMRGETEQWRTWARERRIGVGQ